jgi:hypothetical protein
VPDRWVDEQVRCLDPSCPGPAEPEYDDDIRYYACLTCGFEFGYERVRQQEGTCQLGVAEDVRARFAVPAGQRQPVPISIGRRPE